MAQVDYAVIRIGTDNANYIEMQLGAADLIAGWNNVIKDLTANEVTQTGNGLNTKSITWVAAGVVFGASGNTLSDIRIDEVHVMHILDTVVLASPETETPTIGSVKLQNATSGVRANVENDGGDNALFVKSNSIASETTVSTIAGDTTSIDLDTTTIAGDTTAIVEAQTNGTQEVKINGFSDQDGADDMLSFVTLITTATTTTLLAGQGSSTWIRPLFLSVSVVDDAPGYNDVEVLLGTTSIGQWYIQELRNLAMSFTIAPRAPAQNNAMTCVTMTTNKTYVTVHYYVGD